MTPLDCNELKLTACQQEAVYAGMTGLVETRRQVHIPQANGPKINRGSLQTILLNTLPNDAGGKQCNVKTNGYIR